MSIMMMLQATKAYKMLGAALHHPWYDDTQKFIPWTLKPANMTYLTLQTLLTTASFFLGGTSQASHIPTTRCTALDSSCWPSENQWSAFNESVGGRLIASYPSAAVCHTPFFHADRCAVARQNWTNSFWRTSQPGAYSAILWEVGNDTCSINNGTENDLCGQGLGRLIQFHLDFVQWLIFPEVAEYSLAAKDEYDIQKGLKFASEKNLHLVIKNTGHDQYVMNFIFAMFVSSQVYSLGRSSGKGAFAIWTHNIKGRQWHSSFIPTNAPEGVPGIPAATLHAGEQWLGKCLLPRDIERGWRSI
jgi:hypothetical protein